MIACGARQLEPKTGEVGGGRLDWWQMVVGARSCLFRR